MCIAVPAGEVFAAHFDGFASVVGTCCQAVSFVVLSVEDGWVIDGCFAVGQYVVAASQLSGGYDVESFERSVFESDNDVFEVVAVLPPTVAVQVIVYTPALKYL